MTRTTPQFRGVDTVTPYQANALIESHERVTCLAGSSEQELKTVFGENGVSSASLGEHGELYTSTDESDIQASQYGGGPPPCDLATHPQCSLWRCARQQTVGP